MAVFVERVTQWIFERRKEQEQRDQELRVLARMNRLR